MLLHEMMDEAVADVVADPALANASRRQGLSIRRTRRALASVGVATAAVALAVGVWVMLPPGGNDDMVATETTPSANAGALSGVTAPITDQGVVAALATAVDDVTDGTMSRLQGDVSLAPYAEASADLLLLPSAGAGPAGLVMVNLQPLKVGGPTPYLCDASYMTDCTVRTLANGDTLRTYHDDGDTEFGAASQRAIAEVLSPTRHLRVVVFAMNNNAWEKGSFRDQTVLDIDQLIAIATQPWWSRTGLPREYVDAGKQLPVAP